MNRKALIVGIKGTKLSLKETLFLKQHKPWGVILFSRNIQNIIQLKKLVDDIKYILKDKKYPILIDQEGGRVSRLNKIIDLSLFSQVFFSKTNYIDGDGHMNASGGKYIYYAHA